MVSLAEIIEPGRPVREIEASLLSVLDEGDEGAPYDSRAAAYDRLVSSRRYSQLAWGVPPITHTEFITRGLTSGDEGWVLDVAAGSCVPSAPAYAQTSRPLIVLDRSLAMLRRGIARLRRLHGELPPHVVFLQADANALPFRADSMGTVICHGALHVFSTPQSVCAEWVRVLRAGGQLFASSLVRGRWLGDRYLGLLHRAGEIAPPRTPSELASLVEAEFRVSGQLETLGNFAYLSLRKSDAAGRLDRASAARRNS